MRGFVSKVVAMGSQQASEILDRSVLDGLRALESRVGKEMLPEMVEMFEHYASSYCEEIRSALATSEARSLRQTSHKFKGSARTVGLVRLSIACAGLERIASAEDLSDASNQVATIEKEVVCAKNALHAYLDG